MSAQKWKFSFECYGYAYDAFLVAGRYANNERPAITIMYYDEDDQCDVPWASLTENDAFVMLEDDERDLVINHNLSNEVLNAVIDSGFIEEEPYTMATLGMATTGVHRMTDAGLAWFEENVEN